MPVGMQVLEAARVNRIMQALADVRTLPQQLKFSARTPDVPAVDGEIMARFLGRVQIADIIADDQKGIAYSAGRLGYQAYNIPNLKVGANVTQAMLNELDTINSNGGIPSDTGLYSDYEKRTIDGLLLGVRQRKESLTIGMMLDGFNYNRLGVQLTNIGWGMPADLKVTPTVTWDNPSTATPVTDVLGVKLTGSVRYGIEYDRMTLGTAAFRYMIATTQFQNMARQYLAPNVSYTNLAISNLAQQQQIAEAVLGVEIERYDARVWSQDGAGILTQVPLFPINAVCLSSKADDNDPMAYDFANGIVTESIVADLAGGGSIGTLGGRQRGPVAYATLADAQMNPPGVTYWAVARGFPRKHRYQASAVLNIGTFADTIPTADLPLP